MARKTTSIAFDDENELLELKSDAAEAGMDTSKYVRKIIKEKRETPVEKKAETKPEPKIEDKPKVKRMSGNLEEDKIEQVARRVRNEEKFADKVDKLEKVLCDGPDCILERLKRLEPDGECPSCGNKTLFKGRKKQYCSNCRDGPFNWGD